MTVRTRQMEVPEHETSRRPRPKNAMLRFSELGPSQDWPRLRF